MLSLPATEPTMDRYSPVYMELRALQKVLHKGVGAVNASAVPPRKSKAPVSARPGPPFITSCCKPPFRSVKCTAQTSQPAQNARSPSYPSPSTGTCVSCRKTSQQVTVSATTQQKGPDLTIRQKKDRICNHNSTIESIRVTSLLALDLLTHMTKPRQRQTSPLLYSELVLPASSRKAWARPRLVRRRPGLHPRGSLLLPHKVQQQPPRLAF